MTEHEKMRIALVSLRALCEHWTDMLEHGITPARSNFVTATEWIDRALGKTAPTMSTADRDLRGASLPAPTPEDILEQTRGVK